ncbi:tandem-95 repeat protein [Microvirga sp. BT689]|uniref:tandem-95 repeat protein n=1 Tax=Microvirga arvi TaxID=2778731 RepID=UPI00195171E7|nr:tandem-95 repeat protein [Microvirga arvi]MBM6584405.1 tandem-95 repeat protein [Microvirga arvi]
MTVPKGGAGDDLYLVDHLGDSVHDHDGAAAGGYDRVIASVNFTLVEGSGIEDLVLTGSARVGTGNSDKNLIIGTDAADTLSGGGGADTLEGGAGNDVYGFDSLGDRILELAGDGTDEVRLSTGGISSGSTFSLDTEWGAQVENVTLADDVHGINLTGNSLDNVLVGNRGANVLKGLDGNDTLVVGLSGATKDDTPLEEVHGGAGFDHLVVDWSGLTEAAFLDGDYASTDGYSSSSTIGGYTRLYHYGVERYTVTTGSGNDTIETGQHRDVISAGAGDDTIRSGAGNDTLSGGEGNDWLEGGDGDSDIAVLTGSRADYTFALHRDGTIGILDGRDAGDGQDNVEGIEFLQFQDGTVRLTAVALEDQGVGEDGHWSFQLPEELYSSQGAGLETSITLAGGTGLPEWLTFNAETRTLSGTPPLNFNGIIDLAFVIHSDTRIALSNLRLTVEAVNDAPMAAISGNDASGTEDMTITGKVPAGTDVEGDSLTYELVAPIAGLSFAADGSYSYTPDTNFHGTVSFEYSVVDSVGARSEAQTFALAITPVNDAAEISGARMGTVEEDGIQNTGGILAVADVDAGEQVFKAVASADLQTQYGTFTFNETTGEWDFTLDNAVAQTLAAGEHVEQRLSVESLDGTNGETITVTVTGANDAPVAAISGNTASGTEDTLLTGQVPGGLDVDADNLRYQLVSPVAGLALNPNGTFTYAPAVNFHGTVSFEYQVVDDAGAKSAPMTFVLSVASVNDAPSDILLSNATVAENAGAGTPVGSLTALDLDGDSAFTFSLLNDAGGRFALGADGKSIEVKNGLLLDYEQATSHQVVVRATDGNGASYDETVTIALSDVPNENTAGTSGNDTVSSGSGSDNLSGGAGNDVLNAGGGKDKVNGGTGNDRIIGGAGQDSLTGGSGKDVFVFANKDTGTSEAKADYITDFSGKGGDKIDLKLIDADVKKKGDQAFTFIGKNAFTKAGQVSYEKIGKETFIYLNTDSDKSAEGVIKLKGAIDFSKGWFVL